MSHPVVDVTGIELLGDHRVALRFSDGERRERDLSPLLTGPVFEDVRCDPAIFAGVAIDSDSGVLCWPSGVDVDAELLRYDDLWNETVALTRSA
ncbi:MAG: DUF2442 domain-containing protein [Actinomycetes bacterium]